MKRKIKKFFKYLGILIILLLGYSVGSTAFEHWEIRQMVEEFKSRAYDSYELNGFIYHPVKREHDYELLDQRNVFSDAAKMKPGVAGDILTAHDSPFPYVPVIHDLVTFYFGGHSAIVSGPNHTLQSTGVAPNGFLDFEHIFKVINHKGYDTNNSLSVAVTESDNYWLREMRNESHAEYDYYGKYYRPTIYAMRVKYRDMDTRDEEIAKMVEEGRELVGRALYNYLFIFDTEHKYYCSDLVARTLNKMGSSYNRNYNLNQDGFVATINDLMVSNDMYLTIYKETINDVVHIYYLEDVV